MGSVPHPLREPRLQHPAGRAQSLHEPRHPEPAAGMVADVPHGGHDEVIVDRQDIGALPRGDAHRRQEPLLAVEPLPPHQPFEQIGGLPAGPDRVGDHARERRAREAAEQFVVVHAEDCRLVGHGDSRPPTAVERLPAPDVVAAEHADGLGQRGQPGLHGRVVVVAAAVPKHVHHHALGGRSRDECVASVRAPLKPAVAEEGNLAEVALKEVRRCGGGDRGIVGLDVGHPRHEPGGTDIHHVEPLRLPQVRHCPGDGRRLDPGDDPVTMPAGQCLERRPASAMLGQEHRPRLVLAKVRMDPCQQPPCVGVGGLDDHGHATLVLRRLHEPTHGIRVSPLKRVASGKRRGPRFFPIRGLAAMSLGTARLRFFPAGTGSTTWCPGQDRQPGGFGDRFRFAGINHG